MQILQGFKNHIRTLLSVLNSFFIVLASVLPIISSCLPKDHGWEVKVLESGEGDVVRTGQYTYFISFFWWTYVEKHLRRNWPRPAQTFIWLALWCIHFPVSSAAKHVPKEVIDLWLWTLHMVTGSSRLLEKETAFLSPRHSSLSLTYLTAKNSIKWKKESSFF